MTSCVRMAPHVLARYVGYCCRVNLARGCSLLTSRQVKYVEEIFDLKNAKSMFDFVFRLYNFVSLANEDNHTLRGPVSIIGELHAEVGRWSNLSQAQQPRDHYGAQCQGVTSPTR